MIVRKLLGAVLIALGIYTVLVDYDGIKYSHGGALHAINAAVELGLIFAGIVCWFPALAKEITNDLMDAGKAVTSVMPGGRRVDDPPANPPAGGGG